MPPPPPGDEEAIVDNVIEPDADASADTGDTADLDNPTTVWIVGDPTGSFKHVQPGVKSEFYVDFQTGPGDDDSGLDPNSPVTTVSIDLDGPGVMGVPVITQPFKPNAPMHFVFPINRFGDYTATGDILEDGRSVFHFELEETVK